MEALIADIITREGGFSDRSEDRGGPTKYGITLATLAEWRGHPVTRADVAALTREEAALIYAERYIRRPRFDQIADAALRELVIDTGVNHGAGRAGRWLQDAVNHLTGAGLKVDGDVGPKTLAAVNAAHPRRLFARYLARRIRGYADFVQSSPDQLANLEGWNARAASFIERLA